MHGVILLLMLVPLCYCDTEGIAKDNGWVTDFNRDLLHYTSLYKNRHVIVAPFGIVSVVNPFVSVTNDHQLTSAFSLPTDDKGLIDNYKDFANVLDTKNPEFFIKTKNYLYVDKSFDLKADVKSKLEDNFKIETNVVELKNFESDEDKHIDNLKRKTVTDLTLSSKDGEDKVILRNVLFWNHEGGLPFNKADTKREDFYDEDETVTGKVNMMYASGKFPHKDVRNLGISAVLLPFGIEKKYALLVLKPTNEKLSNMYKKVTTIMIKDIIAELDSQGDEFDEITVNIPRFKLSNELDVKKALTEMGVTSLNEDEINIGDSPLVVTSFTQKISIAAVEAKSPTNYGAKDDDTFVYRCNKPFVYFFVERSSRTVITAGIYSQPSVFSINI